MKIKVQKLNLMQRPKTGARTHRRVCTVICPRIHKRFDYISSISLALVKPQKEGQPIRIKITDSGWENGVLNK